MKICTTTTMRKITHPTMPVMTALRKTACVIAPKTMAAITALRRASKNRRSMVTGFSVRGSRSEAAGPAEGGASIHRNVSEQQVSRQKCAPPHSP